MSDISYCIGAASNVLSATAVTGNALKWYGTSASGGTASTTAPTPVTTSASTFDYYVSQASTTTGCESSRSKITVAINSFPTAPVITRDLDNNLVSSAISGNTWYKNGKVLTDTTQKLKPLLDVVGYYSVMTTQNGCSSLQSSTYYYVVTDIFNISSTEFVKLGPNPFANQVHIDFFIKGYQRLNLEIFEITTGNKVATQFNVTTNDLVYLGNLISGTYLVRISSSDNKFTHKFKMIKI